jgi:peptidoglycan/xylan/chitin deacetylase (PgdA/CDA1 family)
VAITFDGALTGPTATAIFGTLHAFGAKATIYAPARAVLADPTLARRIVDRGDLLAEEGSRNSWIDPRQGQLARLQQTFQSTVGVCPTYFHPPGGRHSPLVARAAHGRDMKLVTWDVSVPRGSKADAASIARDVLRRTQPGSIILLPLPRNPADDASSVVAALPTILQGLRARHLSAVRLDDLLGTPGYAASC